MTFCLARVPYNLTIESDNDAIMIAWLAASAAGGQCRREGEASHDVRAERYYWGEPLHDRFLLNFFLVLASGWTLILAHCASLTLRAALRPDYVYII